MSTLRRVLLVSVLLLGLLAVPAAGQDTKDNSGRDFWLAFGKNYTGTTTKTLFVTGETATTGTVEIPGLSYSEPFSVTPGTVTSVVLPDGASLEGSDAVEARGIHVTAAEEVAVFGLNRQQFTTDAYLGLPTDVIGTDYTVMAWGTGAAGGSQLQVAASEDDTAVEVTPSVDVGARPAGTPFTVNLDRGEAYQLEGGTDLTGTRVKASAPVGVWGGHTCANIPDSGTAFCDHVTEQMTPDETRGTSFVTAPLKSRLRGDTFKFLAGEEGAEVSVDGAVVATLGPREQHQQIVDGNAAITSTKPILVSQFSNGTQYDSVTSDPFMMLIPPFEQFETGYTVTTPASGFRANHINVVVPDAAVGEVSLDGTAIPASDYTAIGSTGFQAAQLDVSLGSHRLSGPGEPFGATVCGYDQDDSYGYSGGLSLAPIARVTALALTPPTATVLAGREHCVTAKVTDQEGEGVPDVRVDFGVSGANPSTGSVNASSSGEARYCYVGKLGNDRIRAAVGSVAAEARASFVASLPEPPAPRPTPAPAPAPAPAAQPPAASPPAGGVAGQTRAACAGLRQFNIRIRYPAKEIRRLSVTIDGKTQTIVRRRPRWVVRIDLRGRPVRQTEVQIRIRTKGGRLLKGSRNYRPCTTKKPGLGFKY